MEIEGAKEGDLLHPPRVVLALRTENELWRRCEQPVTHHPPPPQVGDAVLAELWLAHPDPHPDPHPNPHQVEISVKYASYLERQAKEVARMESHQGAPIPPGTDFASIPCLSREEVDKLTAAQPATLADAASISGITPNALRYVLAHVGGRKGAAAGRRAQGKEAAARGAEGKEADA